MAIGFAGAASAQNPATRIRGSIAGFDGTTLSVATREGPVVALRLPEGFQPSTLHALTMDAIKPNSFVATVATPAADGTLQSSYVAVFPEALRGTGEGHYDWDLAPGTSMTNATVTSIVSATSGQKLSMVYKGTPIDIVVPPGTPIIETVPATRADLVVGAKVFITAQKAADGSFTPQRVTVGTGGLNPPQ